MRGGKRDGAGRPLAPESTVVRIRVPLAIHEKIKELGGDKWIKRVILEALENIKAT